MWLLIVASFVLAGPAKVTSSAAFDSTEDALMAAYAAGDDRAGQRLFASIAPRLRGFFERASGNPALADDLTQQTLLRIHVARAQFRPPAHAAPWIFTIARRIQLDEYRRVARQPKLVGDAALERQAAPEPVDAAAERSDGAALAARVRAALDGLSESQRVVIQMHRFQGMTFPAIAEALGTSVGAVRVRACRAYENLRRLLVSPTGEDV